MPGSCQLSGPPAYDGHDLRFVAENDCVTIPCSKTILYIAREEIEERSPSRIDGIDSSKEYELRKSYCAFLKELGMKLRMPPVVIATSTVFCHRFYLYQSHHKNDRYTIATACMFLAGKVEEARRALEEVVYVSYCLLHKNDRLGVQEFKEKEVCEKQKELVLLAEHMVLVTLDFDLKVRHPYSFILLATSKYKFASQTLIHVSYIILNDVLYTTLCLQFKPQHIAASALLLAAKILKYKFPSKGWWKEFHVTPLQLKEICCQILELYERERAPFSIVQSSSSSSSVDGKAKSLPEYPAMTPPSQLGNNGATLPHLSKTTNHNSLSFAGRPPSTSLPTSKPIKEITKSLHKDVELKNKDPAKRKRPVEDNGIGDVHLKQSSKHKLGTAAPRKASKGFSG